MHSVWPFNIILTFLARNNNVVDDTADGLFSIRQNRESTEGCSKGIVRKKLRQGQEKVWSQQIEHMGPDVRRRSPCYHALPSLMFYGNLS